MAEYAAAYGGLPAPWTPWPLFMALLKRTTRFESRRQLACMDAVHDAIGAAFGEAGSDLRRDELVRGAYPLKPGQDGPAMAVVQSGAKP